MFMVIDRNIVRILGFRIMVIIMIKTILGVGLGF